MVFEGSSNRQVSVICLGISKPPEHAGEEAACSDRGWLADDTAPMMLLRSKKTLATEAERSIKATRKANLQWLAIAPQRGENTARIGTTLSRHANHVPDRTPFRILVILLNAFLV